jgi:type IV pilus assembly protein PilM
LKELTIAKKAVGIDIGNHSIKAVTLAKKGSSVSIKSFMEIPISRDGEPEAEQIARAVETLGTRLKMGSEMIVTSVSTQRATVRNLEIPFSEAEQARQVLKFQTEPYLAFPIEEVIIDFCDTQTAPEGKMKVLLTAIHKGVIKEHLELLSTAQIDPEVVDVDFVGIVNAALWAVPGLRETSAIVINIGSSKTVASYVQEGMLLSTRCLSLAGDDFTQAIREKLAVTFEEAEQIKTAYTPAGGDATDERSEQVAEAIRSVLDRFSVELDRTVRYFSSQAKVGGFDEIVLCGGSAALAGLDRSLAESLAAKVSILSLPDTSAATSEEAIDYSRYSTAIGLALRGLGESPCIQNFRQEEHAYARPLRRLKNRLLVSAALVLGVIGLLVFSIFDSLARYASRKADLTFQIQRKRSQIFPEKTPKSNAEMEKLLEEENKQLKPFRDLRGDGSLLAVLDDLSTRIPQQMKVEVDLFNYVKASPPALPTARSQRRTVSRGPAWAGTITLTGTVSSVADHVALKKILTESEYVVVDRDKGTSPAAGGRIGFDFTLKLKE